MSMQRYSTSRGRRGAAPRLLAAPLSCDAAFVRRQNQIRCVGLNVPYRLVQMVATYGLAAIPPELRAYMPEMDLQNRRHRERFVGELERGSGSAAHAEISPQAYKV